RAGWGNALDGGRAAAGGLPGLRPGLLSPARGGPGAMKVATTPTEAAPLGEMCAFRPENSKGAQGRTFSAPGPRRQRDGGFTAECAEKRRERDSLLCAFCSENRRTAVPKSSMQVLLFSWFVSDAPSLG